MNDKDNSAAESWLKKAEEALQRATDAVAEAWKATEGVRGQAWETAKHAVDQASEALDEGIDAAKQTWHGATGDDDETTEKAAVETPDVASVDDGVETAEPEVTEAGESDDPGADPAA